MNGTSDRWDAFGGLARTPTWPAAAGDVGRGGHRILVPFDGSEAARFALDTAVALAAPLAAQIILLNVVPPATGDGGAYVCSLERLDELHRAEAARLLATVRRGLPCGVSAMTVVADGVPAEEIVKAARTWRADIVVMGTRGRGRLARFFLGGTADAVVRGAPCPVVTVAQRPDAVACPPTAHAVG
jgi:nucleotide-binding universal stress UspA family protein